MIEMQGDQSRTGHDPWQKSPDQQLDQSWEGYLGIMGELLVEFKRFAQFSERQREKVAPTIVDLSPTSGTPTGNTYQTKTKLRLKGFLLTGGAGDKFYLSVGVYNYVIYAPTGGTMPFIDFPIEVDRGVDLAMKDITNPGAVAWSCYVVGYPE
jgi:hypothetical protein